MEEELVAGVNSHQRIQILRHLPAPSDGYGPAVVLPPRPSNKDGASVPGARRRLARRLRGVVAAALAIAPPAVAFGVVAPERERPRRGRTRRDARFTARAAHEVNECARGALSLFLTQDCPQMRIRHHFCRHSFFAICRVVLLY